MDKMHHIELGKKGEQLVMAYLEKEGYSIITHNYQKKMGEIDIIIKKQNIIAFVEVKLRQFQYVSLSEMIPYSKQQKIIKTAHYFLLRYPHDDCVIRFDAALVEYDGKQHTVTYYENAFSSQGRYE